MSTFLYALGHAVARHRFRSLIIWVFLTVICFGVAGVAKGTLVNDYTIPGTESQAGIDTLDERFPQASGTTGQLVFESNSGPITDHKAAIESQITAIGKVKHVSSVDDPFASGAVGTISTDHKFAQSQIQFDVSVSDLSQSTIAAVEKAAATPAGQSYTTTLGGDMYTSTGAGVGLTDLIGVFVAFVVLAITFGSLLAAGMPLLTAGLGVGITMSTILTVASFATISTTTPTLALMIGLAVGIDYGLFIVTRHRRQLLGGMAVAESIAQASATAGSAVVFAGTTVIIALCGLAVANIPFLTVMGVAAAAGVAVAVAAALTLLPAFLALAGEKLRPNQKSRAAKVGHKAAGGQTMGARWVRFVVKIPLLTVALVLLVIAVLAFPVKDLSLALPDNGSDDPGTPPRTTYDLIAQEFGPGYNSPLLVTADIITSTDPKGTVQKLADDIAKLPGVVAITKQTPNETADLGLVRVVPEWSQSDPRTTELVAQIRAAAPGWAKTLKISDITVTGQTAVSIDVNSRLSAALVPFGLVIVGLAVLLLTIVFRSIAVPIKAALGYLLSIAAALGVVTACFTWGWGASLLGITDVGPIVSFLPIILMGVLFGLAMDYEVFLVSAIREDYVHRGGPNLELPKQVRAEHAQHAIRAGFISSSRVVTAAAVIMISVFAAFIPHGSATIKPIALGLAVGVFVDAFGVRMTLVPAVLALLGERAWWMPKKLDRVLPHIDVEGAALVRHVAQAEWEAVNPPVAVRAEQAQIATATGPATIELSVPLQATVTYDHPDPIVRAELVWTLAGWRKPVGGVLAVLGYILPEESGYVRKQVRIVPPASTDDDHLTVRRYLSNLLVAQSGRPWAIHSQRRQALQLVAGWLPPHQINESAPPAAAPAAAEAAGSYGEAAAGALATADPRARSAADLATAAEASSNAGHTESSDGQLVASEDELRSADRRFADRRLSDLSALERWLVALSAAAVQDPRLYLVAEPDLDLTGGELSRLAAVCAEIVAGREATVLLVGARVTALAGRPIPTPADPVQNTDPVPTNVSTVPTEIVSDQVAATDVVPTDMPPHRPAQEPES